MILLAILLLVIVYLFIKKPLQKTISNPFTVSEKRMSIDDKYNSKRAKEQKELNLLLEKINKRGYENLSTKDKNRLNELSKK